ncbi:MAG: PH domain-containing protein [Streptosporangiales bacterium]|nr:PH domain-containing protein [Streptosporangiales bacterium]
MTQHTTPPETTVVTPQHLSPRVLAIHPLRSLRAFAIPLLGVLLVGRFSANSFVYAAIGAAVAVLVPLFRWMTFTYSVRDGRLQITQGLFARSTRTIPLDRIRGVDVSAPLLHRLLGLAVVNVEAAAGGETKEEGTLDAVTVAEADRLRKLLLHRREAAVPADAGAEPTIEPVYARLRRRWCLYAPLTATYLLAPLALLASLIGFAAELFSQTESVSQEQVRRVVEEVLAAPHLLVPIVVALVLAVPALSVLAFAVVNWDFTLRGRDGSLVTQRGLVTRRSVFLERRRIRGWELIEGPLERAARVARLRAIVTGLGNEATRAQLLPLAPRGEVMETAARAVGPLEAPLAAHPAAARTRRLVRACLPWLVAAGVAAALRLWVPAIALGVLALLGVPLGLDRYRSLGHADDGARVAVRSGSLRRRQAVIDHRAVVGWTIKQTWLQRRVRLATLVVGVGAGRGGYSAIDMGETQAARFACEVSPQWLRPLLVRDADGQKGRGGQVSFFLFWFQARMRAG